LLIHTNYTTYRGCSESNASYFIMSAYNIEGGCWYGRRGWPFLPIFHYILLSCHRWQQRGSLSTWFFQTLAALRWTSCEKYQNRERTREKKRERKKKERERKKARERREREGGNIKLPISFFKLCANLFRYIFLSYTINLKVRDELTLKHHLLLKHSSITVFYFDICCDFKNIYSATFFNNLIQY